MSVHRLSCIFLLVAVLFCTDAFSAVDTEVRAYEAAYFDRFAPQTALEMVVRIPGFTLQEADEDRGLSQGGTNVLVNGQPIIGKGETATTQIGQIAAETVLRIEIIDAGTLDLPGFSGLVANIVTDRDVVAGALLWQPAWRRDNEPELLNGEINVSGSWRGVDYTAAFKSTMVRAVFEGPETVTDSDGALYELRDELRLIDGNQQEVSGSISWPIGEDRSLSAKASLLRLDVSRPQESLTQAVTSRGVDSINLATADQARVSARLDADYRFPLFGGTQKWIAFASQTESVSRTRVTIDQVDVGPVADRRFRDDSRQEELILRLEQSWEDARRNSWQLATEAAWNTLDLSTLFAIADPNNAEDILSRSPLDTEIREQRAELTFAHRRAVGRNVDLQLSVGGETSTIEQGTVRRRFDRPKGFASINMTPNDRWTLTARVSRDVGQINFRDFAASVSLIEEVVRENNPELVPQQSWRYALRAEHRFDSGHVVSVEGVHEQIDDLVDRIPLGEDGDAIGNIPSAHRDQLIAVMTLVGAPLGFPGAQLDVRGSWQRSSVIDPIEGFEREIGRLRTRDIRAEFRHDVSETDWAYGFILQDLELAPFYQSMLVQFQNTPSGGLTPGQNTLFVEHKDLMGFRIRASLSEFVGQTSDFARVIHSGRRDIAPIDRVEQRSRELGGPFFSLSVGRVF
ncbi:MAG: hypothetical protein AAF578_10110 [Pseudomonadota bacterium]